MMSPNVTRGQPRNRGTVPVNQVDRRGHSRQVGGWNARRALAEDNLSKELQVTSDKFKVEFHSSRTQHGARAPLFVTRNL